ncbi:hypothetical protein GJU40_05930 [Bacillus lacus]|uniref:Uncharacterized protein n=1 Tax=Metabacillus lacus TaxID=1983721 RepID=A0A7X2IYX8_9BACI|nr:protein YpmT [Metabacillus lacus]MRX71713.1 hypothetical protein [Metabacillus lacus]
MFTNVFSITGVIGSLLAVCFGGAAYINFTSGNMEQVFMNISYSALFLSGAFYIFHLKDEKRVEKGERG